MSASQTLEGPASPGYPGAMARVCVLPPQRAQPSESCPRDGVRGSQDLLGVTAPFRDLGPALVPGKQEGGSWAGGLRGGAVIALLPGPWATLVFCLLSTSGGKPGIGIHLGDPVSVGEWDTEQSQVLAKFRQNQ